MPLSRRASIASVALHSVAITVAIVVGADEITTRRVAEIRIQRPAEVVDACEEPPEEVVEIEEKPDELVEVDEPVLPEKLFEVEPQEPLDEPPEVDRPPLLTNALFEPVRRPKPVAVVEPPPPPKPQPVAMPVEPRTLTAEPGDNPQPEYPARARRRGWQGEVVVLVVVDASGAVTSASVLTSSGYPILDKAALDAARGWRFDEGPGRAEIPFEFRLRRAD